MRDGKVLDRVLTLVLLILAGYLGYRLCLYIPYALELVGFPYEVDVGEGEGLHRAMALARGEGIYPALDREPYAVSNYPPLYDLVVAGLIRLFGAHLALGRAVSVLSALGASFCIGFIVWRQARLFLPACLAGALFLCSSWVTSWSVLARIDMLALALTLAALCLFLQSAMGRRTCLLYLSALLFACALFTRQSMVAAPVSCMILLLARAWGRAGRGLDPPDGPQGPEYRRAALRFGGPLALFCLVPLALLLLTTEGEFWRHVTVYTVGRFSWPTLGFLYRKFLEIHFPVFLASAACVVYSLARREIPLWALYWIAAFLVTVTAGKTGSSINYFLELWAACCIVSGIVLGEAAMNGDSILRRRILPYAVAACLAFQAFRVAGFVDLSTPTKENLAAGKALSDLVRRAPGEVVSEYTGFTAQAGKPIVFQTFAMSQLARAGLWDQRPFVEGIRDRRYPLIITTENGYPAGRWTREMVEAILQNYDLRWVVPWFEMYADRPSIVMLRVFAPREGRRATE